MALPRGLTVMTKLNNSFPASGCQQLTKWTINWVFYFDEKHMATEVTADGLGEEWKAHAVRIGAGNDKQSFPMKQSVFMTASCRVRDNVRF